MPVLNTVDLVLNQGYDCLLDIEDSEKKALAQPLESRFVSIELNKSTLKYSRIFSD